MSSQSSSISRWRQGVSFPSALTEIPSRPAPQPRLTPRLRLVKKRWFKTARSWEKQPSTVTFGEKIVNDTPNGILTMPYEAVKNIHFLKNSFVIEDANGVGIIVSKSGFTDASYMDCVNFLCEQCPNLEL